MKWGELKGIISKAAPLLGTAIGGPAGAGIGSLISAALGVDNDPQAVSDAIKNNPDALIELKRIESDNRQHLQSVTLETLQIELADTQHAREQNRGHWMPQTITMVLAFMVAGMFYAVAYGDIPKDKNEIIYLILGQVLTAFLTSVAYWIGTSRSSHDKTGLLKGA